MPWAVPSPEHVQCIGLLVLCPLPDGSYTVLHYGGFRKDREVWLECPLDPKAKPYIVVPLCLTSSPVLFAPPSHPPAAAPTNATGPSSDPSGLPFTVQIMTEERDWGFLSPRALDYGLEPHEGPEPPVPPPKGPSPSPEPPADLLHSVAVFVHKCGTENTGALGEVGTALRRHQCSVWYWQDPQAHVHFCVLANEGPNVVELAVEWGGPPILCLAVPGCAQYYVPPDGLQLIAASTASPWPLAVSITGLTVHPASGGAPYSVQPPAAPGREPLLHVPPSPWPTQPLPGRPASPPGFQLHEPAGPTAPVPVQYRGVAAPHAPFMYALRADAAALEEGHEPEDAAHVAESAEGGQGDGIGSAREESSAQDRVLGEAGPPEKPQDVPSIATGVDQPVPSHLASASVAEMPSSPLKYSPGSTALPSATQMDRSPVRYLSTSNPSPATLEGSPVRYLPTSSTPTLTPMTTSSHVPLTWNPNPLRTQQAPLPSQAPLQPQQTATAAYPSILPSLPPRRLPTTHVSGAWTPAPTAGQYQQTTYGSMPYTYYR